VPLPLLDGLLGRRRGWAILTQTALMAAIFAMSTTNPGTYPLATAVFALLVAFPLVRSPMMFVFCVFGTVLDAFATLLKSKFLSLLL